MATDWVRDKALMSMTCALAGDALIPTHLVAKEEISNPFTYQVSAISQVGVIDPVQVVNKPACVTLRGPTDAVRYFHGVLQEIRPDGFQRGKTAGTEFEVYSLTIVPRLWFLRQTDDCRVYQKKSTKDILSAMFHDAGLTDVSFSTSSAVVRPYTVQFNESDYVFALRLMEEEGWFYYFRHTATKHTLVITDASSSLSDIPNATLHFSRNDGDTTSISEWKPPVRTAHGSITLADHDPIAPATKLFNKQSTVLKISGAEARDVFRWPALTTDGSVVEKRAKFEMEAAEAAVSLYRGASLFGGLVPGGKFTLKNQTASPDDGGFALRAVEHVIEDSTWISNDGKVSYQNRFEAFKSASAWRQPIATPRPRMDGVYSATVMGPQSSAGAAIKVQDGEEVFTDEYARVKVRFRWDWRADATGNDAIWARVIQPWAGAGWGAQFTPRVGTEVAVAFVDGDPDRPIVIGGLYNGEHAPIYAKSDATKLGFRTRSSLKGDSKKFSELTFDDKSGSELIFIHAEKDLTTEVEHDESLTVDNCRVVLVKQDETITVKGKQTVTITKDHTFEVTEGNYKSTIDKGNHGLTVSMGNQSTEVSMGNYDLKVNLGNITVKAAVGSISMEATQSIALKVGGNSITIDQTGVTIKGMMVSITGQISTEVKGLMTKVGGDAMLTLKGAITMIN